MSSLRQQQQPSPPSNPLRDRSIAGDAYTANVPLAFLTVMYARSPLPTCRTPFFAISFPFSPLHVHPTHPLRFTPSLFSSVLVLTSVVSFLRAHSSPFLSFLLLASSPRNPRFYCFFSRPIVHRALFLVFISLARSALLASFSRCLGSYGFSLPARRVSLSRVAVYSCICCLVFVAIGWIMD